MQPNIDVDAERNGMMLTSETAWLIFFEDQGMRPECYSGTGAEEAARRRFHVLSMSWSCHLFKRVEPIRYRVSVLDSDGPNYSKDDHEDAIV